MAPTTFTHNSSKTCRGRTNVTHSQNLSWFSFIPSIIYSGSRHPSILSDNGKRHRFGHQFCLEQRLAWLKVQTLSGSLCHRWCSRRWRVVWSPGTLDAPSCVVSCPPTACFACPHQSSPLFEQHSAMHCRRLLSAPSCLGQCLQV